MAKDFAERPCYHATVSSVKAMKSLKDVRKLMGIVSATESSARKHNTKIQRKRKMKNQ